MDGWILFNKRYKGKWRNKHIYTNPPHIHWMAEQVQEAEWLILSPYYKWVSQVLRLATVHQCQLEVSLRPHVNWDVRTAELGSWRGTRLEKKTSRHGTVFCHMSHTRGDLNFPHVDWESHCTKGLGRVEFSKCVRESFLEQPLLECAQHWSFS